jgi:single-strand DNA-binding protein
MAIAAASTLVGNLTRDPEITTVGQKDTPKAFFSIACDHRYKDASGEWASNPSYFNVVAWGDLAQFCSVLAKGTKVAVTGRLDQRTWDKDDGTKGYAIELVADEVAISVRHVEDFTKRNFAASGGSAAPQHTAPEEAPW